MSPDDLKLVLEKHAKWLRYEEGGERANLREANLRWAVLCNANLDGAKISYCGKVVTIRFEEEMTDE
jgi:hypothetical protein